MKVKALPNQPKDLGAPSFKPPPAPFDNVQLSESSPAQSATSMRRETPKPLGGGTARGTGAATKGKKFRGVF